MYNDVPCVFPLANGLKNNLDMKCAPGAKGGNSILLHFWEGKFARPDTLLGPTGVSIQRIDRCRILVLFAETNQSKARADVCMR